VGDSAARSLVGPAIVDYGVALLAVGFLGAFLPHGVLQTGMTRDNVLAPVIMGLVAIPVYVTPTDVMMHFGQIVRDGYSLGAAFALIVLGAGANVGVANWLRRDYGLKPLLLFVGLLIGSTLVIGFTADRTIVHGKATMEDHTHAFDSFTRLAEVSANEAGPAWVIRKVRESIQKHEASGMAEIVGLGLLGLVFVVGLVLRLTGDRFSVEHMLQSGGEEEELTAPSWDPTLSARQLVIISAVGVLVLAGIGLYVFYPDSESLMDEMRVIRVEAYDAIRAEDYDEFLRRTAQWRRQAEKLPTSRRIRGQAVTDAAKESLAEFLYGLKTLEGHMASRRFDDAKMMRVYVDRLYRDCCAEFRGEGTQSAP